MTDWVFLQVCGYLPPIKPLGKNRTPPKDFPLSLCTTLHPQVPGSLWVRKMSCLLSPQDTEHIGFLCAYTTAEENSGKHGDTAAALGNSSLFFVWTSSDREGDSKGRNFPRIRVWGLHNTSSSRQGYREARQKGHFVIIVKELVEANNITPNPPPNLSNNPERPGTASLFVLSLFYCVSLLVIFSWSPVGRGYLPADESGLGWCYWFPSRGYS